jgi:hypothetical protein
VLAVVDYIVWAPIWAAATRLLGTAALK